MGNSNLHLPPGMAQGMSREDKMLLLQQQREQQALALHQHASIQFMNKMIHHTDNKGDLDRKAKKAVEATDALLRYYGMDFRRHEEPPTVKE